MILFLTMALPGSVPAAFEIRLHPPSTSAHLPPVLPPPFGGEDPAPLEGGADPSLSTWRIGLLHLRPFGLEMVRYDAFALQMPVRWRPRLLVSRLSAGAYDEWESGLALQVGGAGSLAGHLFRVEPGGRFRRSGLVPRTAATVSVSGQRQFGSVLHGSWGVRDLIGSSQAADLGLRTVVFARASVSLGSVWKVHLERRWTASHRGGLVVAVAWRPTTSLSLGHAWVAAPGARALWGWIAVPTGVVQGWATSGVAQLPSTTGFCWAGTWSRRREERRDAPGRRSMDRRERAVGAGCRSGPSGLPAPLDRAGPAATPDRSGGRARDGGGAEAWVLDRNAWDGELPEGALLLDGRGLISPGEDDSLGAWSDSVSGEPDGPGAGAWPEVAPVPGIAVDDSAALAPIPLSSIEVTWIMRATGIGRIQADSLAHFARTIAPRGLPGFQQAPPRWFAVLRELAPYLTGESRTRWITVPGPRRGTVPGRARGSLSLRWRGSASTATAPVRRWETAFPLAHGMVQARGQRAASAPRMQILGHYRSEAVTLVAGDGTVPVEWGIGLLARSPAVRLRRRSAPSTPSVGGLTARLGGLRPMIGAGLGIIAHSLRFQFVASRRGTCQWLGGSMGGIGWSVGLLAVRPGADRTGWSVAATHVGPGRQVRGEWTRDGDGRIRSGLRYSGHRPFARDSEAWLDLLAIVALAPPRDLGGERAENPAMEDQSRFVARGGIGHGPTVLSAHAEWRNRHQAGLAGRASETRRSGVRARAPLPWPADAPLRCELQAYLSAYASRRASPEETPFSAPLPSRSRRWRVRMTADAQNPSGRGWGIELGMERDESASSTAGVRRTSAWAGAYRAQVLSSPRRAWTRVRGRARVGLLHAGAGGRTVRIAPGWVGGRRHPFRGDGLWIAGVLRGEWRAVRLQFGGVQPLVVARSGVSGPGGGWELSVFLSGSTSGQKEGADSTSQGMSAGPGSSFAGYVQGF